MDIDKLKKAKDFYEARGYKYIEVPWDCPEDIQQLTIPPGRNIKPTLLDGRLVMVGSAEQSFLNKILDNSMPLGFSQTITPCFRNDQEDELHQLYFVKLELISFQWKYVWNEFQDDTLTLASDALVLFNQFLRAFLVKTDIGYDIVSMGIELGSYGFRKVNEEVGYTYGTGLALPRFNQVIQKYKNYEKSLQLFNK